MTNKQTIGSGMTRRSLPGTAAATVLRRRMSIGRALRERRAPRPGGRQAPRSSIAAENTERIDNYGGRALVDDPDRVRALFQAFGAEYRYATQPGKVLHSEADAL